jgi:hypothetical protein
VTYLKIGDWDVHANGTHGMLRVRRIDELGWVSGSLFGAADHRLVKRTRTKTDLQPPQRGDGSLRDRAYSAHLDLERLAELAHFPQMSEV